MKSAVVLACDDKFIPFASIVARRIASLASEPIRIIVVSDNVSDDNKKLARQFCPEINFIEASSLLNEQSFAVSKSYSRAVYLRLLLDDILADLDRIVYVDSDISLLADISPLLNMVPKAAPIIAAHDLFLTVDMSFRDRLLMSHDAPYLNSGVMVLDLKAIRSEGLFPQARCFACEHPDRCIFPDQDALNAVLDGRWQTLDWRWNSMSYQGRQIRNRPFIRHFAGNKPWGIVKHGVEQRFVGEWRANLEECPWPGLFLGRAKSRGVAEWLRPHSQAAEDWLKHLLYSQSPGRKGNRARMTRYFPDALAAIEKAATAEQLAHRSPETSLFTR